MAKKPKSAPPVRFADKKALIKLADELDAKVGIVHDPTATAEKAREMMLAEGIRPEDNLFSRDIIRAKYPDEEDEDPTMAIEQASAPRSLLADKEALIELADEIDAKAGIVYDPTATRKKAREMMLAQGIRPEDNLFSRDIIRTKYPDEYEDTE